MVFDFLRRGQEGGASAAEAAPQTAQDPAPSLGADASAQRARRFSLCSTIAAVGG